LLTTGHLPSSHPVVVDRGRGVGGCGGGAGGAGGGSRTRPAAGRRPRGAARRSCAGAGPLPRARVQLAVPASAGGLPLMGAHAWLSACVARGTPTRCGSESWASSSRCQSQAVCGFRVLQCGSFVEVRAVDCVLSWVVLVRDGGACRAVVACDRGPPSSTSASTSCLSRPVLPRRLWRVVGWVGILLDVIGGVENALWEGCYPALTLTPTCGANRAS
jgi:hypothetical protein